MRKVLLVVSIALTLAALACTAPGAADSTAAPVTVVVTSAPSRSAGQPSSDQAQPVNSSPTPSGVLVRVGNQGVFIHSCTGASEASRLGTSPAQSQFTPTKWDGQNWFYGPAPVAGGSYINGWVSRLNSDGSELLTITGDPSTLPNAPDPCPPAPPTPTYTPPPPTDTPAPTATNTQPPTATTAPTATTVPTCHNGVVDPGEQCGEPGLACDANHVCTSACTCRLKISVLLTPILVQP